MTQEARIKLTSTNLVMLENVCHEIKGIGEKNGIKFWNGISANEHALVFHRHACGLDFLAEALQRGHD